MEFLVEKQEFFGIPVLETLFFLSSLCIELSYITTPLAFLVSSFLPERSVQALVTNEILLILPL